MHAQYLFLAATFAISTFATPLPASSQAHVARNDESYNTRQLLEMVERDIADTEVREVEQKRQFIKGNNRISRDVEEKRQFIKGNNRISRDVEEKRQFIKGNNRITRDVEEKRQFIKGNNRISRDVEEDVEDSAEDSVEEDEE